MAREFDLLGHPIPDNFGKPGANGHVPSAESINKVRVLLVSGLPKKRIAEELGVTIPTLNKHYFHSGKVNVRQAKEFALSEQRAKVMLKLDQAVQEGNVTAMKAMKTILEEAQLRLLANAAQNPKPAKDKPLPKGKKEALAANASDAIENDPLLNPEVFH